MLSLLVVALLGVDGIVVPCGTALCIGGNQQPITLGGTVQVNQGPRPDGGFAQLQPVTQGASLVLAGTQSDPNDGGYSVGPDIIIRSSNARQGAGPPLVSFRSNQIEVARVNADGTAKFVSVTAPDGGSTSMGAATFSGTISSTVASGQVAVRLLAGARIEGGSSGKDLYWDGSNNLIYDGPQIYSTGDIQAVGAIIAGSALTKGTLPCDGGTPAPATTVNSGAQCVCNRTTGAVCAVSGTTLTAHCVAGDTGPLSYLCL